MAGAEEPDAGAASVEVGWGGGASPDAEAMIKSL